MDSLFFEGEFFISNRDTPSALHMYGRIDAGWHHISYLHKANQTSDIEFLINNNIGLLQEIKVIQIAEFRDTDGDGMKDIEEYSNNLNPANTDTDEDGLPDNMDGSPLAKLELDPNQINQMVLSVNRSKDTLINVQIKKPENDYSTNGVPRLWRGAVNVSIFPVLRLFGKKFEHPYNSLIYNLDRPYIEWLWGKSLNCVFKSDEAILENYNQNGKGDTLPNPVDPESEFYFIFPKPALEVIDYDIMIPQEHSSKDDGLLDLRFDFIWVVTEYDYDTGETLVLHYYDFEEPIIVQSMAMREISDVSYTLGNPDCFIENQILWTLTQNPSLGSFEDYGVDDDVELNGTIDYFTLAEIISEYRLNVGYLPNESEVLYMKGFYQNHDILNQIYIKTLVNPDFETLHQGNYSVSFSSYSISNLYENQSYVYGDSEIQGENKVLYQSYSSENNQQRKVVMGVPIAMEGSASSHRLEISQIQGFLDPSEEIPWVGSQLSEKITILHQTYIERDVQATGIPLVHFEEDIDIYKEYIDNRQDELELSHLFFTAQPEIPAELFMNYIEVFWEQIALVKENLSVLYDFVTDNPDFFIPEADRVDLTLMENMLNEITEFQQHSYSEMNSYPEFFQFSQDFYFDVIHLADLYQGKESTDFVKTGFFGKLSKIVKVIKPVSKLGMLFSRSDESVNNKGVKDTPKQNFESKNTKHPSAESQKVNTHKMSRVTGAGCALLGLVMVGFSIYEIHMLASGNNTAYQGIKALKALCGLVASFLLFLEGALLFASSFAKTSVSALKSASKSMGKISLVISIIMFGLDLYKFLDRVIAGEEVDLFMEIFSLAMSAALIATGIAVAVGFCSTGVGAIIGAIIAAVTILVSWVTKYVNAPDLEFVENDCRTFYPVSTILNMRKNGGLEVGDQFAYHLKVKNAGRNRVWMRARMRMAGDTLYGEWTNYVGKWENGKNKGGYKKDHIFEHDLIAAIDGATPNLKYVLEFEADYRHWYAFVPVRKDLTDDEWNVPMNTHALETSISDFFAHTSDYGSISDLKLDYEEALNEYRYWDAYNIGETIVKAAEVNAGISSSHFEYIADNSIIETVVIPMVIQYEVIKYQTRGLWEWEDLLNKFYVSEGSGGWAAWDRPNDPNYEPPHDWGGGILAPRTRSQPDTFYWNMMSYEESDGWLYTMVEPWDTNEESWMEKKSLELSDAFEYQVLINNLPIRSNLSTDLRKQHIEVDPFSGIAEVTLTMNLEPYWTYETRVWRWPGWQIIQDTDGDKIVAFQITPPEGYSISPQNVFVGRLDSTVSFNLTSDSPEVLFGLYFFNISVYYRGHLIYKESVPFKVGGFSCMEFEAYTATESIVPGQLFNMVELRNLGTFTEVANITVEGIPESFIYKSLYPERFINGSLLLALSPGDTIPGLIINPPRHHSTAPGTYSYIFHAQDHIFTN
ncbi:MAG: COG1470 family protein, partial [Candidatus Kariarchaeaceae archaeon]